MGDYVLNDTVVHTNQQDTLRPTSDLDTDTRTLSTQTPGKAKAIHVVMATGALDEKFWQEEEVI